MPLYKLGDSSPVLPDGFSWIADTAILIGDIVVEEDVGIWFGSVLRGDVERISVGRGSNIQEQCVLHTDAGYPLTIGAGCTIGHKAMVHGCTVGDGSLIGINAVVLNGAKIGKQCLIGANALVTEGMEIPDRSLVLGSPGKVRRTLDDESAAALMLSAETYQANLEMYSEQLKRES